MATITADLKEGFVVEIRGGNHVWRADEPESLGGTDTGPNPYDLLLSAVASCTCITVSMYCRRKGWELHSISVRYEHDHVHVSDCDDCEDESAGYIDRVRSEIFIEGDFDAEQRERLTDIARRCPVHRTIDNGVEFTTEMVFVG
jgi:putative redox protein